MLSYFTLMLFVVGGSLADLTLNFAESDGTIALGTPLEFTIKKLLGTGGMSVVLLVNYKGQNYALKVPAQKKEDDNEFTEEAQKNINIIFENEWKATCQLKEDGNLREEILKLIAYGEVKGDYVGKAILMEHVASKNLYELGFETSATSLKEILTVGFELVTALEGLFLSGMTHRDLKPDNLLYRDPVKKTGLLVFDFAFANFKNCPLKSDYMFGTPMYITPNLHTCGTPNPKDDLRTTMYILIAPPLEGILPWQDECNELEDAVSPSEQVNLIKRINIKKYKFENTLDNTNFAPQLVAVLKKIRDHLHSNTDPKDYSSILSEFKTQLSTL